MNTYNQCSPLRNTPQAAVTALGLTLLLGFAGTQGAAGSEAKKDNSADKGTMREMPRIKEASVTTIQGNENWDAILGFGKDSDMAEMMTLMMVGGSGMEHMKMAARKSVMMRDKRNTQDIARESQGLPIVVHLSQNPPAVGENMLDVAITDASGKPMTGLKLITRVAMTSMDMGTEYPKSVEGKTGHYSVPVKFSMKGPWQVVLRTDSNTDKTHAIHATLDFNVDGKTLWKMPVAQDTLPAERASISVPEKKEQAASSAGTAKSLEQARPISEAPVLVATNPMPAKTAASDEKITPRPTEAVPAPDPAKPVPVPTAPLPAPGFSVRVNTPAKSFKVGKNMLDATVLDPAGKPVTGAKVSASVEMTSMDMGVTRPKALTGKDGHYLVPVEFSMKGPWRVTLTVTPPGQKSFTRTLEVAVPK